LTGTTYLTNIYSTDTLHPNKSLLALTLPTVQAHAVNWFCDFSVFHTHDRRLAALLHTAFLWRHITHISLTTIHMASLAQPYFLSLSGTRYGVRETVFDVTFSFSLRVFSFLNRKNSATFIRNLGTSSHKVVTF